MKKVSFDFDGTLQTEDVQAYAKTLIEEGYEVWVVTTRYDENHQHKYVAIPDANNDDLWEVVDRLGIPRYRVRFTCMEWKYTYLNGTKFVWHLDDNIQEMVYTCDVPMIDVNTSDWISQCNSLLS